MVAALLGAQAATAAETPKVVWHAPAGCPVQGWFLERLEAEVGGFGLLDMDPPWLIWIGLGVEDGQWTASVHINRGDDNSERDITGKSCQSLAEGVVLIVALAMDEGRYEAPPPPEPRIPVRASGDEAGPTDFEPRGWLGVAGDLTSGPMPGLASGVALRGTWEHPSWSLGWRLRGLPRGVAQLPGGEAAATFFMLGGGPEGCLLGRFGGLQLAGCAQGEVGAMGAQGDAIPASESGGRTWFALGAEGRIALNLISGLRVELGAGASWIPFRPSYFIGDGVLAHRPGAFELRGALGLAYRVF